MDQLTPDQKARQGWLSLLAKSDAGMLSRLWAELDLNPAFETLRRPEIGSVLVRGRTGATGSAFNLGEMTVTRASIRLSTGEVGHGYVQGRNRDHAQLVATIDALLQTDANQRIQDAVLGPLSDTRTTAKRQRAAKADKTRVEFFTIARGSD
ncbi:MAG: phosphonate C-P lyase system protein PhnG [Pseudomonadota bacterium]